MRLYPKVHFGPHLRGDLADWDWFQCFAGDEINLNRKIAVAVIFVTCGTQAPKSALVLGKRCHQERSPAAGRRYYRHSCLESAGQQFALYQRFQSTVKWYVGPVANLAPRKDAGRVTAAGGASAVPAGFGSSPWLPGGLGIILPAL